MGWFTKKPPVKMALCLTDIYYRGTSYRANLDKLPADDPLVIQQPYMFMILENEENNA
jgi:hypothetical protein